MHSHGKIFYVPALCIVLLALVTTASAAVLGVLSGCKTADAAHFQPDAGKDAKITSTIQARLASDGEVNPFKITVTTNDGVVTLKGRVNKADTREKAERYARETGGVQRVIDLVKVGDRQ
jgi:osmotically-inducible protein OsmY